MADCNCNLELNKQLQGVMARVSHLENNTISHFYAMSMAIQGLFANPLTTASVASVAGIFNLLPTGFQLLQNLIAELNPADFKKLMMSMAAGLLGEMEAELVGLVNTAFADINAMITSIEGVIVGVEDEITAATTALDAAIHGGIQAEIDAATATLNGLNGKLAGLLKMKGGLLNALDGGVNFLTAQAHIAGCKSISLGIGD
jgi:hypothetical protein